MSNELARRCRRLDANPEANQPASNKVKNTSPRRSIRQTRAGSVSAVPCGVRRSCSLANKSLNPHRCWLLCQRAAAQRAPSLTASAFWEQAIRCCSYLCLKWERRSGNPSANQHGRYIQGSNQSARWHSAVVPSPDVGVEGGRDTMVENAHLSSQISFVYRRSVDIFKLWYNKWVITEIIN